MHDHDDEKRPDAGQHRPRTSLEEVIREIEDAETHPDDSEGERHEGEAGDALSTNRHAQEDSRGD
ncbi:MULTISPECIES: hypothetical protein [Streptomyces]|uniref:Uncharacterized protein n=1 Tax=Streptomyces asoensis TaxID=249586 RepID=A0ABQ3S767_9ACTN|nr:MULTISPECIES: hypothetical protein [Streptomyces]MBK3628387.1 hypothetical protein [Streptomyces sp. MBT49]MBK3634964.1 hypothetical protein [Streptomyces sp. MBT97]GGQ78054.1 hypothetical protein GCM10010496_47160 [Streptomyces asoensis]GHI63797.1 hypothetical protein Saso_54470 [Streptomyces asoensis]